MLPVAQLPHLEHVLQTVSVLESVVLSSFGPEGGQVLFTRDTGQAMLSRSGTKILTALRLENPLARVIVASVLNHSTVTGDGSKTFILLLASLLRMIHATACKEPNVSHTYNPRKAAVASTARHLAKRLLEFALEDLDELIAMGVVPYGCCLPREDFTLKTHSPKSIPCVQKLLASFFHSRLGQTHCGFFSHLTCELLDNWKLRNDHPSVSLQFINDNLPTLHTPVSGFPSSCSRLIEGQVIHRDFATPCIQSDKPPVAAVILTGCLQPKLLRAGEVLELACGGQQMAENSRKERSIVQFSAWAEKSLECAIANLQSVGVSVILSAVKQSAAVLALAAQAEICIVECVSEDELSLFAHLSGAKPVADCWMIEPDNIATLTFCRPILLGAHRYVHVAFHDSDKRPVVKPCSLIICGAGEGQTDQYACALHDAIRMLLSTWEPVGVTASKRTLRCNKSKSSIAGKQIPNSTSSQRCLSMPGCVVPAGGIFEFLLHHALLQHGHSCSASDETDMDILAVSQLLANALLSVPRQIYSHSPRCFLQTQTRLLRLVQSHSQRSGFADKLGQDTVLKECEDTSECTLDEGIQSMHLYRDTDMPSKAFMFDSGVESVSCKYNLLLAVLQCLSRLLQVDAMLHIRTASQSQEHENNSCEGTKEEAEE
ncbi:Bardet-Biedl syndrome 10 protein isoform X1 [Labrus mixtus]|uniref:Bardet-Biedl syndrome 10 protein isoform X1 n=1 Tax=Labrus mixtus TaxID=508554 RepID=UPI0029C03A14|nr:Bardet-Biedl syndrome 10 protein isoform X1 [Labrus mixtus]XP_060891249.1 Bardet-Biedl syndrome 10 protein isoform X1 [Labrus mixtus]